MPATILVVEDMEEILAIERELLEFGGYLAIGAASADEALAILASTHIDVLFSDIRLKDSHDGIWLAEQAVERQPDLHVILATAYAELERVARSRWTVMMKPYNLDQLLVMINGMLQGKPE